MADDVRIPNSAVGDGTDISEPTTALLESLLLLPIDGDVEKAAGFKAAFKAPPQSVAVIEAGATAASKWWAGGLGATAVASWASMAGWWKTQDESVRVVALGGVAIVTAALAIAIGYLIASDVRGRAAASVATINARASIARAMVEAAEGAHGSRKESPASQLIPLPAGIQVKNNGKPSADEDGWLAVAMERDEDGRIKYLVVKGSVQEAVSVGDLEFV